MRLCIKYRLDFASKEEALRLRKIKRAIRDLVILGCAKRGKKGRCQCPLLRVFQRAHYLLQWLVQQQGRGSLKRTICSALHQPGLPKGKEQGAGQRNIFLYIVNYFSKGVFRSRVSLSIL